jgi:xanthine/CO dehydrogenase XdhC/CoxF family maturation factor
LDLGGDTPATIALSIVAEVQAKLAKATAASLHKKDRIHQTNAHQDEPKPWNIVQ